MNSGKASETPVDPLTSWELAALQLLIALKKGQDIDVKASKANMLALMQALDKEQLNPALQDPGFMKKTETLLLSVLRGDRIQVTDPSTYAARREIIAAAQVIYNQAVARGWWDLHPEIRQAMRDES
jgi:hypothetical protein